MWMLKDLGLMLLVGDGMIGVVTPERHLRRWTGGRLPRSVHGGRGSHRNLLRLAAAVEAGTAIYMARRLAAPQR
jgi:hypothetical protein